MELEGFGRIPLDIWVKAQEELRNRVDPCFVGEAVRCVKLLPPSLSFRTRAAFLKSGRLTKGNTDKIEIGRHKYYSNPNNCILTIKVACELNAINANKYKETLLVDHLW